MGPRHTGTGKLKLSRAERLLLSDFALSHSQKWMQGVQTDENVEYADRWRAISDRLLEIHEI